MHRFFHQTSVPSGVLSIGMVETINQLPDLLSAYCSRYPQVDLSLTAGVTERLLQHVLDVELDGAFVTGPISHPLIEQVQVFTEELVLVTKGSSFALEEVTGKGAAFVQQRLRVPRAAGELDEAGRLDSEKGHGVWNV